MGPNSLGRIQFVSTSPVTHNWMNRSIRCSHGIVMLMFALLMSAKGSHCLTSLLIARSRGGWTLQELLVLSRLEPCSADWYSLTNFWDDKYVTGTSRKLMGGTYSLHFRLLGKAISTATGIDRNHFLNFKPGFMNPSSPERTRWVARRVTSGVEDKSHCMMGIFGVGMVVAYREGPEHAFFRLFQAILEVGYARDWFL